MVSVSALNSIKCYENTEKTLNTPHSNTLLYYLYVFLSIFTESDDAISEQTISDSISIYKN